MPRQDNTPQDTRVMHKLLERYLSPQSWPGGLGGQVGVPRLQQVLKVLLVHRYCSCPVCGCLHVPAD